jgi:hypothetical protein
MFLSSPWSHREAKKAQEAKKDAELAQGLGWASVGIGLTELAAPQQVERMLGLEDNPERRGVIRVLGVRELMHGLSILTEPEPTGRLTAGVWSRVAGDVLDTVLLGIAATRTRHPARFAATAASVLAIGALDMLCAERLQRHHA